MHRLAHLRSLSALLIALALTDAAMAQSSKDYAKLGRIAWNAFECSALASKSKNPQEQDRLFRYGYEQGLRFIDAVRSGDVERQDVSEAVPLAMALRLNGPTADFILGRVFEASQKSAIDSVYKAGETVVSDELQITLAKNEFLNRNCQGIGTGQ
jgi:hypothetical protein